MSAKSKIATLAVAAAMSGMVGATALTMTGCQQQDKGTSMDKGTAAHDCKGMNACKGQGGCKTDSHACKGQNACKGQGGCKAA
jgi:hypothetical protein